MEKFLQNSWELVRAELDASIQSAYQTALPKDLFDSYNNLLDEKNFELQQFPEKRLAIEKDIEKIILKDMGAHGLIKCKTISELQYVAQKLGCSKDDVRYILSHENSHANEAEGFGHTVFYHMRLFKSKDGSFGIQPSTFYEYDDATSTEDLLKQVDQTIRAPDALSDSDKKQLGL